MGMREGGCERSCACTYYTEVQNYCRVRSSEKHFQDFFVKQIFREIFSNPRKNSQAGGLATLASGLEPGGPGVWTRWSLEAAAGVLESGLEEKFPKQRESSSTIFFVVDYLDETHLSLTNYMSWGGELFDGCCLYGNKSLNTRDNYCDIREVLIFENIEYFPCPSCFVYCSGLNLKWIRLLGFHAWSWERDLTQSVPRSPDTCITHAYTHGQTIYIATNSFMCILCTRMVDQWVIQTTWTFALCSGALPVTFF